MSELQPGSGGSSSETGGAVSGGAANGGGAGTAPATGGTTGGATQFGGGTTGVAGDGGATTKPTGGASGKATGGTSPTGGSKSSGGTSASTRATGGALPTGGASAAGGGPPSGGTKATGGSSNAAGGSGVGGRGAGICPGGTYPDPDLSGVASAVNTSNDSGQYEGTLWLDSAGVLLFSGMNTSASGTPATVIRLTPPGTVNVAVSDSGTNGLAIDFDGNVLAGSQKDRGIVTVDVSAGTTSPLVTTDASGHKFNSVNDLTVRTDGNIYFTDPDYQLGGRTNETGMKGVYRYSPAKVVSVVDSQFSQPNGVSLSPDESTLYVADTQAGRIRKFAIAADGTTSGKSDFANVTSPDGGAVDCAGNLYWASNSAPGKVVVISPTGTPLGTISVGSSDKPTNVAFGGTDHKTLYISTSPRKIYAIALNVPGFPY